MVHIMDRVGHMVGHYLNLGANAFCLSLLLFIKIEKGNPNALIKANNYRLSNNTDKLSTRADLSLT